MWHFFHVMLAVGSGAVGICRMAWGDGCHSVVRLRTNTECFQLTSTFSEAEAALCLLLLEVPCLFIMSCGFFFLYLFFFFASVCKQQSHSHVTFLFCHAKQSPHTPDPELQLIWHQVPASAHGCGHRTAWCALLNIPTDLE